MVSMDLDSIIKDLNKRFAAPLPKFYKRRIIFWHDEDKEFEDKLDEVVLDNAKLLVLTGTNNFAAKSLLNVEDTTNNYLVYSPFVYESQENNWLLNIELYSEEFRADLVSIWMNEINLPATADFRRMVKNYKKFFGAIPRRAAFNRLNKGIATASQMHLAVMVAICGISDIQPASIVCAVIDGGVNMEENVLYQGLVTYGADKPFWVLVKQATGYSEAEESTIGKLITHILMTATTRTLRTEYLAGLDSFISTPHQSWCYDFVSDWIRNNQSHEMRDILRTVEAELMLVKRFKFIPVEDLVASDVFPCIDECILTHLMSDIKDHIIDVDKITATVEKRRTGAWYEDVSCYYEGILQVAKMQNFFLEHSAGFHTVEARNVWKEYTSDYYHMDTFYRQYHLAFGKSLLVGNEHLDDLFKQVTEKVEGLYTHWFLGELGKNWSDVCAEELSKFGKVLEVPQQKEFYSQKVKRADSRVFVIISDALRFEVAATLSEKLRRETKSRVELGSMEAIFPTVTKYGMAALLPHKKLSVVERDNGTLQVLADDMSTESTNRDKVLKNTNANSVALQYKTILPMSRAERSALVKGMDVVYIYHDKVDEASHTSDSAVFPACDDAITEIKNIVRIITNEFSGTRIFITADHGFLYTYSPLSEDSKVDKTTPTHADVEIDRRYLITRKGATPDYLLPVKYMDENYDAFAPRESVRIKKKGSGLNFYQKDAVGDNRSAANYNLYFVDSNGTQISDTAKIIADEAGLQMPQKEEFQIDIAFAVDEFDFFS